MGLASDIYLTLPYPMQNLALSIYGLHLKRQRYSPAGKKMLDSLMRSQEYDEGEIATLQSKLFVAMARHAIENTKFYQAWSRSNGIRAGDIQSLQDITLFPIITKKQLRDAPEDFRDQSRRSEQFSLFTSGTTGSPTRIYCDNESRSKHYAFFSRLRASYNIQPTDKRATLFGRTICKSNQKSPPFWRHDKTNNNLLLSSYHLSEENLEHYIEKLESYKACEIFSYPSSLYQIAKYCTQNNIKLPKPKLIMTTAERLLPSQAKAIEAAFGTSPINQYGCTEMAFFCHGMWRTPLQSDPEHSILEVSDQNRISIEGSGGLIATGLVNKSMPVIRYEVGDNVSIKRLEGKSYIESLDGRLDDLVYKLDGTPVGRLDPIFKGYSDIDLAQIHQKKDGSIILRIVPGKNYQPSTGQDVLTELKNRVGSNVTIEVEVTQKIQTSKNGKFRSVISELKMD